LINKTFLGTGAGLSNPSKVSSTDKPKWYRQLAVEARLEARRSSGSVRDAYLAVASQWEELANVAEELAAKAAGSPPLTDDSYDEPRDRPIR
jgi:hypothetical protein